MRKLLILLLALVLTLCTAVVFASCKIESRPKKTSETSVEEPSSSDGELTSEEPTHAHEIVGGYHFDETNHWLLCATCNEMVDFGAHKLSDWIAEVPAEGETDGAVGHYECEVCGEWFGEDKRLLGDDERVIKAYVTLTLNCYSGEELVHSEQKRVKGGQRISVKAPVIDYYTTTASSQMIVPVADTELSFEGYKAVYKVVSGSVSEGAITAATSNNTLALKGKAAQGDATYELSMASSNTESMGLVFNYDADGNYYWFYLRKADSTANLARYENGNLTTVYSNYLSADYDANNFVSAKVTVKDGTAYCYLWNSLIAVYEVGTSGGDYGFRAAQSGARFEFGAYSAQAAVESADTLLFGHSYFAWWNNYYYDNLAENMATIEGVGTWKDIAIGGSIAAHWNNYENSILAYRPSLGIYMIGINDISGNIAPATVAQNVKTLLLNVKAALPEFKAVLMGVNRCPARTYINDMIAELNDEFRLISASYDWISFAEIEYAFCDQSGQPVSEMFSDGLHPTPQSFTDVITPAIKAALAGENQPDLAQIVAQKKSAILAEIEELEISKYYSQNADVTTYAQAIENAETLEALESAYEGLTAAVKAADHATAVSVMDEIFGENSVKSSWDAVVANVNTWTHAEGSDSVTINHATSAGWQLTEKTYENFEMTIKVDIPTTINPYAGNVTRAFLFGAESNGFYPRGYAVSVFKLGSDAWLQLQYLSGNGVMGQFIGGVYGDFTDTEIKVVVSEGKLYFYYANGVQIKTISNSSLSAYVEYLPLDYYGEGGSVGILSWDSNGEPAVDTKLSMTAFKEKTKTMAQLKSAINAYVDGLNVEKWYASDTLVLTAIENATDQNATFEQLTENFASLKEAVSISLTANAAHVLDQTFSYDYSSASGWDLVQEHAMGWDHPAGSNYVQLDGNAGWQLSGDRYGDMEMTVKFENSTDLNPYGDVINGYHHLSRCLLIGATSVGRCVKGYAVTVVYDRGNPSNSWIQLHYMDGVYDNWGFPVAAVQGNFENLAFKIVISGKTLSFTSLTGNAYSNDTFMPGGAVTLDNYVGGGIGILSWDGTAYNTKFTIEGLKAERINDDGGAAANLLDSLYASNAVKSASGTEGWAHVQGSNKIVGNDSAGFLLTADTYYEFEAHISASNPTTNNPYEGYITRSFVFGAQTNAAGDDVTAFALTYFRNGDDSWIQLQYTPGNGNHGGGSTFLGGWCIMNNNVDIKIVVKNGYMYATALDGSYLGGAWCGTDGDGVPCIALPNYVGGRIGILQWNYVSGISTTYYLDYFKTL